MKVLSAIFRILVIIILAATVVSNLAVTYIVFAPDNLPKPFYLAYAAAPAAVGFPLFPIGGAQPTEAATPASEPTVTIDPEHLQPGQGIMLDTGTKIVNLADPGGRKFVRVNVVLEFAPENPAYYSAGEEEKNEFITTFSSEIAAKIPVINDILVTLLSSKTFEQVYTAEGKDALRTEIITQINGRLIEYKVTYVYFTEFAVQ